MRRYRRSLYRRMHDVTTLVTGPSGTGKELVARAIALSRYIPFDSQREMFVTNLDGAFHALNLSALSPTLIESELFGHRKGAFTGALEDRVGWLESCPPLGTVLLDEIGELDASIQVKLLRVLQTREFQRIGETTPREFKGKLIAATNRDLDAEMRAGRFREDLYYRLCADLIATPSLRDQLRDSPDELPNLVLFVSERVVGADEASDLADEVLACIERDLGADYAWPGNVQGARAVRLQRAGAQAVPPEDRSGDAECGRRRCGGMARRRSAGQRTPPAVLHAGLRDNRKLSGDRSPTGSRPAHREAIDRSRSARAPDGWRLVDDTRCASCRRHERRVVLKRLHHSRFRLGKCFEESLCWSHSPGSRIVAAGPVSSTMCRPVSARSAR